MAYCYKKITNCANAVELRNLGNYLYNLNWGRERRTTVKSMTMYSKTIAQLQIVMLELWVAKTRG
jgi:hypothetical protein